MKPLVWSHSFLDTFDRCPRQAQAKFVTKELPFESTPEMEAGTRFHEAMRNAINNQTPLPADLAPFQSALDILRPQPNLQAEMALGIGTSGRWTGFFSDDVWGRGKLDVVTVRPDRAYAFILDWKTGKVREDPAELECHAVLLKAAVPELQSISGAFYWTRENRIGQVHTLDFGRKLHTIRKTFEQADGLPRSGQEWPARENAMCGWCKLASCRYNPNRRPMS